MTKTFLSDYGSLSIGGRYRPLYRLFEGEEWRMVSKDKRPVLCDTAGQAIQAAKDRVKEILNSRILSEKMEPESVDPLQAEIEEFLKNREAKAEAEKRSVFGDEPPKAIFPQRGRMVVVQRKRRRAKA